MPLKMTQCFGSRKFLGFAVMSLASAGISRASVVTYGNFVAPHITYQNVSETDTQLPGPTPPALFGAPTLAGDALTFTPLNFTDSASGGSFEFQDGRLTFGVQSTTLPPVGIGSFSLTEGGGWALVGGTSATIAEESLLINQLFITQINGVSVNPIVVVPTINFTDTNGGSATVTTTSNSIKFSSAGGFSNGSWNATATFDLAGTLASDSLPGSVTGLSIQLNNQLVTISETNSSSFIDKKFFNVNTTPLVVPEPTTAGLGLVAAAGLLSKRRRRVA